jgi:hypothetical protein
MGRKGGMGNHNQCIKRMKQRGSAHELPSLLLLTTLLLLVTRNSSTARPAKGPDHLEADMCAAQHQNH